MTYVGDIAPRQQDLGDGLAEVGKQAVPETHEAALADGCEGLQLRQVLGPLLDVHPAQADADSAGRDDDDFVAILSQLDGRLDDGRQDGEQRLMALFVDDGARAWVCQPCQGTVQTCDGCRVSSGVGRCWVCWVCCVCWIVVLGTGNSPSLITTPRGRGPLMAAGRGRIQSVCESGRGRSKNESQGQEVRCIISHLRDFSLTQIHTGFHYIASGPRLLLLFRGAVNSRARGSCRVATTSDQWDGGSLMMGEWHAVGGFHWPTSGEGPRNPGSRSIGCMDVTARPSSAVLHRLSTGTELDSPGRACQGRIMGQCPLNGWVCGAFAGSQQRLADGIANFSNYSRVYALTQSSTTRR